MGQRFDELDDAGRVAHFELYRAAGLYRPQRAETIAPDSGNCRARSNGSGERSPA